MKECLVAFIRNVMYNNLRYIKWGENLVYTVTLNPALDYVMQLRDFNPENINRSENEALFYGGKGINVSAVLNCLEIENIALGFLAGFTGEKLEKMLEKDGINCDFNYLSNGMTRINVKIKTSSEFDINASGPSVDENDIKELIKKMRYAKSGDFVVLSGAVPSNLSSNIYEEIMSVYCDKGINFVVDSIGDLLLNSLKCKPFLIKPNHLELGELFGTKLSDDKEIIDCGKKLQDKGAKNILVSRAEEGAILLCESGQVLKIGNAKGRLVNSVGCGDSMLAGFIAGYIKTKSYSDALLLGTACGNATAFSVSLANQDEIMKTLNIVPKCEII